MRGKTDQIIEAAIMVFTRKGFLQATTQEIAKEANVAEVTLYRKFSTKQNLFECVVEKVLEEKFENKMLKVAVEKSTEEFLISILSNRLELISKNNAMVKMLISESLAGNLPEEVNFINLIFKRLKEVVQAHFYHLNQEVNSDFLTRQLGSILLGYAILPNDKPFHELTSKEKKRLVSQYVNSIKMYI